MQKVGGGRMRVDLLEGARMEREGGRCVQVGREGTKGVRGIE